MKSITQGQIYFAIFFALAFIIFMVWSYRKDLKLHKRHYKGSSYILLGILLAIIFLFIFKDDIKG